MGLNLIVSLVVGVFMLGGAAFVWHGIGSAAVAKHEQAVKVEQDKIMAVAKAKIEERANALIDMQAAYEQGQSEREVVEKKIYLKGQDYAAATPVFQNKDCVVPGAGMAILNGARGDLQNTTVAEIFGFDKPLDEPVRIKPPPKPAFAPAAAPATPPATGSRPKPVPVK